MIYKVLLENLTKFKFIFFVLLNFNFFLNTICN